MSSENIESGESDSKATPANVAEENISKTEATPETLSEEKIQELDTSYRILNEIIKQNKSTCWPFMEKVDVQGLGLWDYEQKVKEPMWINKILEKFDKREYTGITDFARDFRTMVENCYRYNGTEHAISKKAKHLEMALEAKLALLKKDYREKTELSVTSNGKFAVDMNGYSLAPVSRYGRIGNTREYASVLDDRSTKLVYDFVRCEETVLLEDEKKASHRERRQQEILFQQMAAAWINSVVENHPDIGCIKTCHALPEVALFLQICEATLKFPEMNMYQFERSLLVPNCSIYLSKLMTPLLCSYQERGQINSRPPMHFQTWNSRLKERLVKWFELVQKYQSYTVAAKRIGLNVEFFKSLEWKNPFFSDKVETFSDLKYDQKVQILKALCDALVPLQVVQNALFSMDPSQLQCMQLGKDFYGNVYIYFPQFCGDEVRVYRHREYGAPVLIDDPEQIWSPPKPPSVSPDTSECSPLVNGYIKIEADGEEDSKVGNTEPVDIKGDEASAKPPQVSEVKEEAQPSCQGDSKPVSDPTDEPTKCKEEPAVDPMLESQGMENQDSTMDKTMDSVNGDLDSSQDGLDMLALPAGERRTSRVRKQTSRYQDTTALNHNKKGTRKRPASQQKKTEDESTTPKKQKKPDTPKKVKKEKPVRYGNVDFEMLCDSVDAIQLLINKLQSDETSENASFYGHNATGNHKDLIEKLRWLYDELEPWNVKIQKARLSAQIQMKKEHNQIENSGNQFDPWTEELSSRVAYAYGENLTISHTNSPMSSVESFEDDEDDISHPYYTRFSLAPKAKSDDAEVDRMFDENLYEEARITLLPAALTELEEILKDNVTKVMKVASRSDLAEHNADARQRTTRHKVKQQNKLLGKVLTFAENNTKVFPSLVPILIPNSDVFDIVDMVFLKEETRLQEIEDENRRKRLERSYRRQKSVNVKLPEKSKPKKHPMLSKMAPTTISIRMHNGRVYPATRLSDGRVIPIMREDNSSPASSVEELLETTHQEIKKSTTNQIPTISLKGTKSPAKKCPPPKVVPQNSNSVKTNATNSGAESLSKPSCTINPNMVNKVKHAPKRIVVTQPLQRAIGSATQSRPVVTHVIRHSPVRPIILNGQRYGYVSGTPTIAVSPQAGVLSAVTSQPIPVILSQPTQVAQPPKVVLTPVQVVSPSRISKPSGVVLVPFQNCDKTAVNPVRMVSAAPVLGVITSPQRQLQFQNKPEENKP